MLSAVVLRHGFAMTGLCALLFAPRTAWAQQSAPTAPVAPAASSGSAAPAPAPGPFTKNAIGVELAGSLLTESWNFNGAREWWGAGSFAVSWAFKDGMALVVEFQAAGIEQSPPRSAFLNGITPMARFRLYQHGATNLFLETGAGVSWSDTVVPPRGTRFNYLIIISGGVTHQLSRQTHFVASARLLHLSNASLKGRDRNPDIEALGGYFGIVFVF